VKTSTVLSDSFLKPLLDGGVHRPQIPVHPIGAWHSLFFLIGRVDIKYHHPLANLLGQTRGHHVAPIEDSNSKKMNVPFFFPLLS